MIAQQLGTPDVIQPAELPRPVPGPGQVLIRVRATSVNPIDIKVRSLQIPMTPQFPAVLHGDVAGVVEALGEGVDRFQVGDEVFGCAGGIRGAYTDIPGALAEYMAADVDLIALKPRNLSFAEAAALPLVSLTAWIALREKVTLDSSTSVLVHGGTGGVGHLAIQLARLSGARVFTTVSSQAKADIAQRLGADVVINYRENTPEEIVTKYTDGRGFDVIFDTVGGEVLDNSFTMIRPGGEVITIVGANSHHLGPLYLRGGTLHTVLMLIPMMYDLDRAQQSSILDEIRALAEAEKISPLIDEEHFTLDRVADAHRKLEAGAAIGKIVIEIPQDENPASEAN